MFKPIVLTFFQNGVEEIEQAHNQEYNTSGSKMAGT
jgi:hypothetical protein